MTILRDYVDQDAPQVGRLIADTYRTYNLNFVPDDQVAPFLGPFANAHSLGPDHQQAIMAVIRSATVLVAEDEGEIVGVLRGRPKRLGSLFVRGDRQRRGIGRMLVERFEAQSKAEGVQVIHVAATLYGVPFYLALGYKRSTGVRNGWSFQAHGLPVQPMKKIL